MKKKAFPLLLSVLLFSLIATGGFAQAQDPGAQPGILAMLDKIPVSSFADGWLSFVDVEVLIANTPGAVKPISIDEYERLRSIGDFTAELQPYAMVFAGPSNFNKQMTLSRDMLKSSGIDYFKATGRLEVGMDINNQMWLSGDLDMNRIKDSLVARRYQRIQETVNGFEIWGKEGRIDNAQERELSQLDASFPFGGIFANSWPVILAENLVISSRKAHVIQGIANPTEPPLSSHGTITDTIASVTQIEEGKSGSLAQIYLLTPSAARLQTLSKIDRIFYPGVDFTDPLNLTRNKEKSEDGYRDSGFSREPLPPYSLLAISHVFSDDAQWIVLGLAYPDEKSADAALPIIQNRFQKAVYKAIGDNAPGILQKVKIQMMGGQTEPLRTVIGRSGSHVLLIPFRFQMIDSAQIKGWPELKDNPFSLFTVIWTNNDLGWLTIGKWPFE